VDIKGGYIGLFCIKEALLLYRTMANTKIEQADFVHLRIPRFVADLIARESFQSGVSKQEVVRQILRKHFSERYGADVILDSDKVRKTIENQKPI